MNKFPINNSTISKIIAIVMLISPVLLHAGWGEPADLPGTASNEEVLIVALIAFGVSSLIYALMTSDSKKPDTLNQVKKPAQDAKQYSDSDSVFAVAPGEEEAQAESLKSQKPQAERVLKKEPVSDNYRAKIGLRCGLNLANTRASADLKRSGALYFNRSKVTYDREKEKLMAHGFGGVVEYWALPFFAIQANLLYNLKGSKIVGDNFKSKNNFTGLINNDFNKVKGSVENTLKLKYLSLPILGMLSIGKNNSVNSYISAGPEINLLLSAKQHYSSNLTRGREKKSINEKVNIKDRVKPIEFGINFGGGIKIPLDGIELFVDGRYGLGLTNAIDDKETLKHNVIYLNVGVLFGADSYLF